MGRRPVVALSVGLSCSAPNGAYRLDGSAGADGTGGDATGSATGSDAETDGGTGAANWLFEDVQWDGEFSLGDPAGVGWNDDHLQLEGVNPYGEFRSRIFDAGQVGRWSSIAWSPLAPYGKPLPDEAQNEKDYTEGNAEGFNNVLLLHMDEPFGPANLDVPDTAGAGNDGVLRAPAQGVIAGFEVENGIFGGALFDSDPGEYVELPVDALAPGDSDFTWSLWVRGSDCTVDNTWLALDAPGMDARETPTVWIGCYPCPDNSPGVAFGMFFDDFGDNRCVATDVSDPTRWRHYALVKAGHPAAEARAYVDGEELGSVSATLDGPLWSEGSTGLHLGGDPFAIDTSVGIYDEVAMWHRALEPDEVRGLYLRGARRLEVRVRACQDAECSDDPPFVGPDGTPGSAFIDPGYATTPGTDLPLVDIVGRFVQYEATFERPPNGSSPGLAAVKIVGGPL